MSGAIQKKEKTCASTASQQVVEFGSEQIAVGDSGLEDWAEVACSRDWALRVVGRLLLDYLCWHDRRFEAS